MSALVGLGGVFFASALWWFSENAALRAICLPIAVVFGGSLPITWRIYRNSPAARLSSRDELSTSEFIRLYGQGLVLPEAVIEYSLRTIGEACHVKPGRLRPTDRFDSELMSSGLLNVADEPEFVGEAFRRLIRTVGEDQHPQFIEWPDTVGSFLEKLSVAYANKVSAQNSGSRNTEKDQGK